jgi:hypothetical protein
MCQTEMQRIAEIGSNLSAIQQGGTLEPIEVEATDA